MGLALGCLQTADTMFGDQFGVRLTPFDKYTNIMMEALDGKWIARLYTMGGDCTACTLHLEYVRRLDLEEALAIIHKYMSINARISAMFSYKVYKNHLKEILDIFRKFPVMGLHVQKSNRAPEYDTWQITGILKVPNPHVNTYFKWDKPYDEKHNIFDTTSINKINAEFGLPTL